MEGGIFSPCTQIDFVYNDVRTDFVNLFKIPEIKFTLCGFIIIG